MAKTAVNIKGGTLWPGRAALGRYVW